MVLDVKFNLKISQFDVETAYLNKKINAKIFIEILELLNKMLEKIIVQEKDTDISERAQLLLKKIKELDMVCRLNKAFYALRQAGLR